MYQCQLPTDPIELRQLAAARLKKESRFASSPTDDERIRELQLQKCELELKVAELERVNRLLTAAVDGTPEALFIKDATGKYLLLNRAGAKFVGEPIEQLLGKDDRSLFDAEGAAQVMAHDRKVMESCQKATDEQTLNSNGVVRTFLTTKSPLLSETGKVIGVVGTARDVTGIKSAEAKLKESELRFRTLAENLPDSLYVLDPHDATVPMKILYSNEKTAQRDGYSLAEILGKSLTEMLDTPSSAACAAERRQRIASGEIVEFEVEHRHRLGHVVPYEVRAVAIPWEGRSAILGINRDCTARKHDSDILRRSHAFQDALIRSVGQGISVCYRLASFPFTNFTVWNDRMVELTGYTREEINERGCLTTLYPEPEAQQAAAQLLRDIWAKGDVRSVEKEIVRKDGERRTVLVSTTMVVSEANEAAVVASFTDITELKKSAEALRASEARYRTFVDHVADGLFLHDHDGTVLDVNRRACESLGRSREELVGQMPYTFDPVISPERMAYLRKELDEGNSLNFETCHQRDDGTVFPVEVRVRPFTENGRRLSLSLATDITRRKLIEDELRQSNERFRLVVRATNDAVWDWVPGTKEVWWSEGMSDLFGHTPSNEQQDPDWWVRHIHPDDRQRVKDNFFQTVNGEGSQWSAEYRFLRRDGQYVDVYDRGQIMRDENGKPSRMVGAMMDVSKSKLAEAQLRATERRFRDLADAIPQIVWTARPDGGLDHLNARATEYAGLGLNELTEWSWEQVIHPDDLPATLQDWGEILRTGTPKQLEFRIRRHDGEYRWHITRQVASRDAEGRILHWYGTSTDIEDYKRVETALRESQQRFTQFMMHLPGLAWIKDLQGRYVFANETALKLFRCTAETLVGKRDVDIFDAKTASQFRRNDLIAQELGGAIQCIEKVRQEDGRMMSSLVSKFVIPGPDKCPALVGGVAIDITSQTKAEEALRGSEERYRTLFHSIPDPMFVYDPDTLQYTAVNDAAVAKYGYSRQEFLRMKITDIRPPEDVQPLLAMLSDQPVHESRGLWRHQKKNGEIVDVDVTAHSLLLDGKPACIVLAHDVTARLRAEAEVRRTTELLKTVTDESPDAVFVKDREGRYLLFNPAAARFVGRSVEEVLGKDDRQLFPPDDAALIRQSDLRVMETGQTETNEEVLTAAGVTRTYLATKGPYRNGDGQIVGTIGVSRDVTASKQAERLVKESQQRLQALFNNALNAIFLVTHEGQFVDANPAACEMLGFRRDELLATSIEEVLNVEQSPTNATEFWEPFLRDGNQRGLMQLRRKDGAVIIAEFSAVANVLPGIHLSVLSDVTERKQAEEAFRKVSAFHERIIRTAVEGICLFTPTADGQDLHFSVWNDQMTAITGYTREEINKKGWIHTVYREPKARQLALDRFSQLQAGNSPQGGEWEIVRKDGERRFIAISSSYLESDESTPLFVALMQDITDRRRDAEELAMRQAELRHVSRLNSVGQMVAVISHEVAQPLAAISNFAASTSALLANPNSSGELVHNQIDQITQQSRRAAEIIRRLRDFSRKSPPQRKLCDLRDLLQDSVDMLSHELRRGEVNILWEWGVVLPAIQGDAVQLQQVFVNLLLNARDALLDMPAPTRRITIRSSRDLQHLVIDVEDNGIGLSEEVASRLFEPFVTTKPQGMGIGLSICRSILQEHEGDISCQPLKAGGTRFRIRLACPGDHDAERSNP
ncbi:PAS domain S-box protein [Anatilimnocola sp. NA78]|uniref:PAS domain S-box protein n=1 Tax=Anatilimnocola sp. NA78 TaxID=3415683 RepID=UPI003CE523ED